MAKKTCCAPVAVERWVRNPLTVGSVDYIDGVTVAPALNGGGATYPGDDIVQGYIDANIDYDTVTGQQTGLTVGQPTTTADETDSRVVVFQTEIPAGSSADLTWQWTGEGWGRVEVDEGCCGCWETVSQRYHEGAGPNEQVTATLGPGLHAVRFTNVDVGGASSIWTYVGDTITFAPLSEGKLVERATVEVDCCGNVTRDGVPFDGDVLNVEDVGVVECEPSCKRLGDRLVPSEIGPTIPASPGFESSNPPVGSLYHPAGVTLTLTPDSTAVGGTASTEELVIKGVDGCDIPVRLTVERRTAGGAGVVFRNNRIFYPVTPSDMQFTVELLPDCYGTVTPVEWALWAGSIGNSERLDFNENPVTSYAQGPGGQNISGSLPYNGTWVNGNNNNTSGFGFDASTTLSFYKAGAGNVGANLTIGTIQVPECTDVKLCDIACLLTDGAGVDCDEGVLNIPGAQVPLDSLGTRIIYRNTPTPTPGLRARWWLPAAGPHLDPLEWAGPPDGDIGFPLPTATPPDDTQITTVGNINDSNSGPGEARYGIIDGWIFLPDDVTHLRDNNANTGELGMVLIGSCCNDLTEAPGGNHTTETSGGDTSLMSPTPITGGWHYIYSPQSDGAAFGGLDLEYSTGGAGGPWVDVTITQPELPAVEVQEVLACDPIPAGWQVEPLTECCQPRYTAAGAGGLTEAEVQALIDAQDHDDPAPATVVPIADNETDTAIRTGTVGTSLDYARADHNHPIRRQANPGDPAFGVGGNGTIVQTIFLDRWSTEESYEYHLRIRFQQAAGTGWGWITVPTIAGFQQPQILNVGNYRFPSTAVQNDDNAGAGLQGAAPRGPFMGTEFHHWSSTNRVYSGYFRRDNAIDAYVGFVVRYIRN